MSKEHLEDPGAVASARAVPEVANLCKFTVKTLEVLFEWEIFPLNPHSEPHRRGCKPIHCSCRKKGEKHLKTIYSALKQLQKLLSDILL